MSKPSTEQFFEHAMRNAGRPPFAQTGARVIRVSRAQLSRRPRAQQLPDSRFFPQVIRLPENKSDQ